MIGSCRRFRQEGHPDESFIPVRSDPVRRGHPRPAVSGNWRKSSYSGSNGDCIEVASFRKSSHSANNGACVEVGQGPAVIGIRDSKLGDHSPVLSFSAEDWRSFASQASRGEAVMGGDD